MLAEFQTTLLKLQSLPLNFRWLQVNLRWLLANPHGLSATLETARAMLRATALGRRRPPPGPLVVPTVSLAHGGGTLGLAARF